MRIAVLLPAALSGAVAGFTPPHPFDRRGLRERNPFLAANDENAEDKSRVLVVVVGKIILDRYGDPRTRNDDAEATIGGGGPQAAWGACAGLAARNLLSAREGGKEGGEPVWTAAEDGETVAPPPKQGVVFLAPVGLANWTPERTESLNSLLPMLRAPPTLVASLEHVTPTIDIWHDGDEAVSWTRAEGSFGEGGADGLWRNRPCARDILDAVEGHDGDVVLHAVLEAGDDPAGGGLDALPFFDPALADRVSAAGVEPVAHANAATGVVSREDATGASSLLTRIEASLRDSRGGADGKPLVVSPDRPCHDALLLDGRFARGGAGARGGDGVRGPRRVERERRGRVRRARRLAAHPRRRAGEPHRGRQRLRGGVRRLPRERELGRGGGRPRERGRRGRVRVREPAAVDLGSVGAGGGRGVRN